MERGLAGAERARAGVQDCVLLERYDSEHAFVDNIGKRFNADLIYTYIGRVLLSVNPYRPLANLYGPDTARAYRNVHYFEAPPHIYAVAATAHRSLTEERRDQCILISGESGSGKTEASKKVLQFVAEVTQQQGAKDKLLQSNPLLEAFGNATTGRNDNSSRFGKYMDIAFDATGVPVGGNILNYLLEKSRVVHRTSGDRNFHVFYQLLEGADDATLTRLNLDRRVDTYAYLAQSSASPTDVDGWRETQRAMQVLELSTSEQTEMFAILASVLHLGNVTFAEEDKSGKAHVDTATAEEAVRTVARLVGCDERTLMHALTHRTIDARGDVVVTPLSRESAAFARDALAKAVYDRLFTWLVRRLNASLQPRSTSTSTAGKGIHRVMGILDIYGFEIFDTNSFEQFCINYCNEKLQQLFIELTLRSEQEEYKREGVEWEPVPYFDNKIICDLIEEKHKGIISIMDEECLRPGDATDASLLAKLGDRLCGHPRFVSHPTADKRVQKTMRREEFKVAHYAGEVTYTIDGFLEKNNDLLFRDLRLAMSQTTNSITKSVFPEDGELTCKRRPETAVTQFKASLGQLMVILSSKEPSYIRCIKPNEHKAAGVFDERIVAHQVQYLGLMENVRVRRAGFAYRRQYDQFLARYKSLCAATWPRYDGPACQGVRQLVQALGYTPDQYRLGNTKIFIRYAKTLFDTEDALQTRKHSLAAAIQARWRGFVQRRLYLRQRQAAVTAQCWIRRYLARRTAQRRRAAATAIRNFIQGFMTRGGPQTELNSRFHQTARRQYLTRLAHSLPHSLLVNTWPVAPLVCREASLELRRLHRAWLSRKYRLALTDELKEQLELKALAESLFRGKRKSYGESVAGWFLRDRLTESQRQMRAQLLPSGQRLLYSSPVHKFDRHGYKRRDRVLVLTDTTLYLAVEEGGNRLRPKHRLPWRDAVTRLEVTGESDRFVLLRLGPEHQKTDKGDLILEMPNVIEFATLAVSETDDHRLLNINTVENGQITHQLSDGSEGRIDLALGQNGQAAITKSKSGHLIVVG